MTSLRRALLVGLVVAGVGAVLAGCSSPSRSASSTTSTTSSLDPGGATTSTTTPTPSAMVFTTVDGAIDAYESVAPYTRQRVAAAGTAPGGALPHGQICFSPDGTRRFVVAESTPAGSGTPARAGFGLYQLTGTDLGSFAVRRVAGFASPSAASADGPTTYGCAFLADGRLLTTDVGNLRDGTPTGQLVEWFPPYDSGTPASCVVASALGTPLGLAADSAGNVYLASARTPTAGVWRYSGTFPAAAADCVTAKVGPASPNTTTTLPPGNDPGTDPGTSVPPVPPSGPPAVTATLIVPPAPGPTSAPTAVAVTATDDGLVVSSAPFGSIITYDVSGGEATPVLSDPSGAMVAGAPFPGGTPLGVVVGPDNSIYYADVGLLKGAGGVIAPADRAGSIRRLAPAPGQPGGPTPETMNDNLSAPDGIGLYLGPTAGGGASIA